MSTLFKILICIAVLPTAFAEKSIPSNETVKLNQSSKKEAPQTQKSETVQKKSVEPAPPAPKLNWINFLFDYSQYAQVGVEVGILENMTLGYRYGSKDFRDDISAYAERAEVNSHAINADWYFLGKRFQNGPVLSLQAYRLQVIADKNIQYKWQHRMLRDGKTSYGLRSAASYKWFSEEYGLNAGPGLIVNLSNINKSIFGGFHFTLGIGY
ncbi:MAG: hypothetical protein HOE90_03130 [Bacteriovoracaceae bacterium]|nr:hypothetical protein [Bacteriovoracaceae bacterium]